MLYSSWLHRIYKVLQTFTRHWFWVKNFDVSHSFSIHYGNVRIFYLTIFTLLLLSSLILFLITASFELYFEPAAKTLITTKSKKKKNFRKIEHSNKCSSSLSFFSTFSFSWIINRPFDLNNLAVRTHFRCIWMLRLKSLPLKFSRLFTLWAENSSGSSR